MPKRWTRFSGKHTNTLMSTNSRHSTYWRLLIIIGDNWQRRKRLEEIPEKYRKGVKFHYVENVQEVWDFALTDEIVANPIDLTIETKESDSKDKES